MQINHPSNWNIQPYSHIDMYDDIIAKGYNSTVYCYTRGLDFDNFYNPTKSISDWLEYYQHTANPKPGDLLVFRPNKIVNGLEYPLIAGVNGTALIVEDINENEMLVSQPSPFNYNILEYQTIPVSEISKYHFITNERIL